MGIIRSGIPIREAGLRRSAAGGLVGDTRIIQYAQAKAHAQLGGCREMHLRLRPGRGAAAALPGVAPPATLAAEMPVTVHDPRHYH